LSPRNAGRCAGSTPEAWCILVANPVLAGTTLLTRLTYKGKDA
jgi:hypothetical protein